jgi:hypothetical protein
MSDVIKYFHTKSLTAPDHLVSSDPGSFNRPSTISCLPASPFHIDYHPQE